MMNTKSSLKHERRCMIGIRIMKAKRSEGEEGMRWGERKRGGTINKSVHKTETKKFPGEMRDTLELVIDEQLGTHQHEPTSIPETEGERDRETESRRGGRGGMREGTYTQPVRVVMTHEYHEACLSMTSVRIAKPRMRGKMMAPR
jgi:hypothetical protein